MGAIAVRVKPGARRDEIIGEPGGALLIRVRALPIEGKANAAVERVLARRLGIAPSRVKVTRGASARTKLIEVEGIDSSALLRELGGAP